MKTIKSLAVMAAAGWGAGLVAATNNFTGEHDTIGGGVFLIVGALLLYQQWFMRPPVGQGQVDPDG